MMLTTQDKVDSILRKGKEKVTWLRMIPTHCDDAKRLQRFIRKITLPMTMQEERKSTLLIR